MHVIFDIDGTLIRSTHVDDGCFAAAVERVLGIAGIDTDWARYEHSTDDGLIVEIAQRYGGRAPSPGQIDDTKREFFARLRRAVAADPCAPVDGAAPMLDALRGRAGWRIGVSSGTSEEAARIKLAAAGLSLEGLPATFSHRCPRTQVPASRAAIISATRRQLAAPDGAHARAVYVGDGLWDLRAARELAIGFVGVRHDGDGSRLRAEGAGRIVRDYRDLGAFVALLEEAAA